MAAKFKRNAPGPRAHSTMEVTHCEAISDQYEPGSVPETTTTRASGGAYRTPDLQSPGSRYPIPGFNGAETVKT
jgi:hypothetical protein